MSRRRPLTCRRASEATINGRTLNTTSWAAVYRELRARAEEAALRPLLGHSDPGVRSWAGAHALEFSPRDGEKVLEELTAEPSLVGFNAQMTLETWREGKLRFP